MSEELALGRGEEEKKSYTEKEKHVQGPCGRKTQWAETLKVGLISIQRVKGGLAQDVVQTMQDFIAMRMIYF